MELWEDVRSFLVRILRSLAKFSLPRTVLRFLALWVFRYWNNERHEESEPGESSVVGIPTRTGRRFFGYWLHTQALSTLAVPTTLHNCTLPLHRMTLRL